MSPTLVEPNFIALCNAILAIGSDLHLKRNPVGETPESTLARNMSQYFQTALYYRPILFSSPPSTLKLQVQPLSWILVSHIDFKTGPRYHGKFASQMKLSFLIRSQLLFCHSRVEVDLTRSLLSKALECLHALGLHREATTNETARHEDRENLDVMCRLVYIIKNPFSLRFGFQSVSLLLLIETSGFS
jgi:hypothetical protein